MVLRPPSFPLPIANTVGPVTQREVFAILNLRIIEVDGSHFLDKGIIAMVGLYRITAIARVGLRASFRVACDANVQATFFVNAHVHCIWNCTAIVFLE